MDKKSKCFIVSFLIVIMLVSIVSPISALAKTKLRVNHENSVYNCRTLALKPEISKKTCTIYKNKKIILSVLGEQEKITWSSSNTKIAIVSKTGVVKGKRAGKCYIKATAGDHVYRCKVTVKAPRINKKSLEIEENETYKLKFLGATTKVKWKSSNQAVVTVSKYGTITAHNIGKARVVAIMNGERFICEVCVVQKTASDSVSPTPIKEATLTPTVTESPVMIPTIVIPPSGDSSVVPGQVTEPDPDPVTPTIEPTPTNAPTATPTEIPTNVPLFNNSATILLKDSLTKEEYEYHGDYYNSTYVESIEDLRPIINKTIASRSTYNFCAFVYSRRGTLDYYSNQQAALTRNLLLCNDESKWMDCYYARGSYLFRTLGYDYQEMCGAGIDIIVFDKEFDEGDYSIYSIYGYADTTAAEFTQVQAKITGILPSINHGTTYDKVKNALDYLCDHINYQNGGRRAQSAYGALIDGACVCEGYASAYKLLLDAMGIPCEIVSTKSHAWNIVQVDGQWYHVDVTHCDQNPRVYYKFMIGRDVLYSNSDVTYDDGYVMDSFTIKDYGYIDGSNQCQRELAESSYRP